MVVHPLLIFDFDNTLVDTRRVGVLALLEVEAFLRSKNLDPKLIQKKDQLFLEFEKNLRAFGEDLTGKVDIETWRSRLWVDAAKSAGEISIVETDRPDSL